MFNNHPSGRLIEAVMFLIPDGYMRGIWENGENSVYQFKRRASIFMIVISIVTSFLSWLFWLMVYKVYNDSNENQRCVPVQVKSG